MQENQKLKPTLGPGDGEGWRHGETETWRDRTERDETETKKRRQRETEQKEIRQRQRNRDQRVGEKALSGAGELALPLGVGIALPEDTRLPPRTVVTHDCQ